MNIGNLRRRIEVLSLVEEQDTYGAIVGEWLTVGRVWAKIEPLQGVESYSNDQVKDRQSVKITIRFYAGLTVKHRIKYLDNIYEITAVMDEKTEHRWTVIHAKEVSDENI